MKFSSFKKWLQVELENSVEWAFRKFNFQNVMGFLILKNASIENF